MTLALVALTLRRQFRVRRPLLEPELLRDRRLLTALFVLLAGITSLNGLYFLLPQYFQHVVGLSALHTGLLLLPLAIAAVAASLVAPLLLARMRPSTVVAIGATVAVVGFLGLVPRRWGPRSRVDRARQSRRGRSQRYRDGDDGSRRWGGPAPARWRGGWYV